jgi:hypothetical protein
VSEQPHLQGGGRELLQQRHRLLHVAPLYEVPHVAALDEGVAAALAREQALAAEVAEDQVVQACEIELHPIVTVATVCSIAARDGPWRDHTGRAIYGMEGTPIKSMVAVWWHGAVQHVVLWVSNSRNGRSCDWCPRN